MEENYSKKVIKDLCLDNPNLNNIQVAKLYNETLGKNFDVENLRKAVGRLRKKIGIPNAPKLINETTENSNDNSRKVNNEKGTLESIIEVSFEPRNDVELAKLHKIDLTKYTISSYWSKLKSNGKFTSSVFCTLKKLGDSISLMEVKNIMNDIVKASNISPVTILKPSVGLEKALMIFVSDEHIGAAVSPNGLYKNDWNRNEYFKRKSTIIPLIEEQTRLHGRFDEIVFCTCGDNLDGFNGFTTRGGHKLPQNMSNKEAVRTYVEVNKIIFDEVIKLNPANKYKVYNVENSNHGGLGFDAIANIGLEMYLKTKYPFIEIIGFENLIGSFSYGVNNFHVTHGKDDTYMKRNFPFHLDLKTESFIKEYMDENGFRDKTKADHLIKGDLHKFGTEQGKFFTYNNVPSLFGGTDWVAHNFGKSKPGYCMAVVNKNDANFNLVPIWI